MPVIFTVLGRSVHESGLTREPDQPDPTQTYKSRLGRVIKSSWVWIYWPIHLLGQITGMNFIFVTRPDDLNPHFSLSLSLSLSLNILTKPNTHRNTYHTILTFFSFIDRSSHPSSVLPLSPYCATAAPSHHRVAIATIAGSHLLC